MTTGTNQNDILDAIMEASIDAIVVADQHGKILSVNSAATKLFGHACDEMIGQNVKMLMPDAMAARHDEFMDHHIKTGDRKIIGIGREVEGLRKDGTVVPVHLSVGRADGTGKGPIFTATLHDLSERRNAQLVLERSQRLDAIGRMTGGIAHDFNNLLTVIVGNLELLEAKLSDAQNRNLLRDALDAAELGADLTHRLMIFARRSNLKPVPMDLRKVCTEALAILHRVLGDTYTLRTEFALDTDLVEIDAAQFQSALLNLALNARDAMEDGGDILISIENISIDDAYMVKETDIKPGKYVKVSISDNGAGMSQDAQKRAFEPFFTTKAQSGGTGLGLAMVYGFVRQSGGHVTLYSEIGIGTSFGLFFPAATSSKAAFASDKEGSAEVLRGFAGKRALVVEDNAKVRELSVARLQDLGFDVVEAINGVDAYAKLKSGQHFDLIFSDVVMPGGLNGYELAEKATIKQPGVKVLLTSGYASDVVIKNIEASGHYDLLHKPYRLYELSARLHALFSDD